MRHRRKTLIRVRFCAEETDLLVPEYCWVGDCLTHSAAFSEKKYCERTQASQLGTYQSGPCRAYSEHDVAPHFTEKSAGAGDCKADPQSPDKSDDEDDDFMTAERRE